MHENDYIGRPEEKLRHKDPNELTDVGRRVESWRERTGLKVKELVLEASNMLPEGQGLDPKDYWAFVRGQRRITDSQIRAIARTLGTTVHIMTHYLPWQVPEDEEVPEPRHVIRVDEPTERAKRKRKAQGTPKPKPTSEPYDPEKAAKLLSAKFGDRVKRAKS